jgi:hypothetical protein
MPTRSIIHVRAKVKLPGLEVRGIAAFQGWGPIAPSIPVAIEV